MDDFKSVSSEDRESGRSKIVGFKSERNFLKAVYFQSFLDRTFPTDDRLVC